LIVVPLTLALPTARGLSAFFVAIIAGVNAYSWHVTSPTHRTSFVPLQVGAFLFLLAITQLFALVRPDVVPSVYGVPVLVVMVVVSLACVAFVEYRTVDLPDQDSIFEASILSGGGES
jgi:ABC-type xylose transport system permease subunit